MTYEQFKQILTEEGFTQLEIDSFWHSRPTDDLDETLLRKASRDYKASIKTNNPRRMTKNQKLRLLYADVSFFREQARRAFDQAINAIATDPHNPDHYQKLKLQHEHATERHQRAINRLNNFIQAHFPNHQSYPDGTSNP